jgi:transcriptional repressor NrdR
VKCPYCSFLEDRVLDSRSIREGEAVRRRRECLRCERRFTTYEEIEEQRVMVVKKDGRREPFDREKILRGLRLACMKRPVGWETLERIVEEIEREIYDAAGHEVPSSLVGERVVDALRHLDPVAYVRFASVYRDFQDVTQFGELVERLAGERRPRRRRNAGPTPRRPE